MGDALFAQTNFAGALENYRAVLDDFTNFPAVAASLGDRGALSKPAREPGN